MIPEAAVDRYDRGATGRPVVVLVHGTMDRAASFRRTARRLEGIDVVAFDRRGYDRSHDVGATADMSRHIADALHVAGDRPAVMIGHSFGGLIALGAAEAAPTQVTAIGVYETPAPWLVDLDDPPGWSERDRPEEAAAAFFRSAVGDAAWRRLGDRFRAARRSEGPAMVNDLTMAKRGPTFDLRDVLQPVDYALGDGHGERYRASAAAIVAELPDARVTTMPGPAHGAHLSHPDAFARWILGLL